MDIQREKEIQELCRQVLEDCFPEHDYQRDFYSCNFCGAESHDSAMSSFNHDKDCAYLIAKDLSTNGGGLTKKERDP